MKHVFSTHFARQIKKLPKVIKEKFYKQLVYLLTDIRHPSLRCKKYGGTDGIWQARVDDNFRFYFQINGDIYLILDIIKHPK